MQDTTILKKLFSGNQEEEKILSDPKSCRHSEAGTVHWPNSWGKDVNTEPMMKRWVSIGIMSVISDL